MPAAAHAATRPAPLRIVSIKAPNVAGNNLGAPYTIYLSNGVTCSWVIGDHAMSNFYASGEADVRCPYAYSITEKVNLDYAYAKGGAYSTFQTSGWKTATLTPGVYGDIWTPPACWPGAEPNLYWTTYAWISVGGSPYYEDTSVTYGHFEPTHC